MAVLGLCCSVGAFYGCVEQRLLVITVHFSLWRLLSPFFFVEASLIVQHRLQSAGSVLVVLGLSCSEACEIFPDQGSSRTVSLLWQVDSYPPHHQERPLVFNIHTSLYNFLTKPEVNQYLCPPPG